MRHEVPPRRVNGRGRGTERSQAPDATGTLSDTPTAVTAALAARVLAVTAVPSGASVHTTKGGA